MNWKYKIGIPSIPGLPVIVEEQGKPKRNVPLAVAQQAVFAAAVQGQHIITNRKPLPLIEAIIFIYDQAEFEADRDRWLAEKGNLTITELIGEVDHE